MGHFFKEFLNHFLKYKFIKLYFFFFLYNCSCFSDHSNPLPNNNIIFYIYSFTLVKRHGRRFYVVVMMVMVLLLLVLVLMLLLLVLTTAHGVMAPVGQLMLLVLLVLRRLTMVTVVPSTCSRGEIDRFRVGRVPAGLLRFGSCVRLVCCKIIILSHNIDNCIFI